MYIVASAKDLKKQKKDFKGGGFETLDWWAGKAS